MIVGHILGIYVYGIMIWWCFLLPKNNLVENIGMKFTTHTYIRSDNVNYKTRNVKKLYKNLSQIKINIKADNFVFNNHFGVKNYFGLIGYVIF